MMHKTLTKWQTYFDNLVTNKKYANFVNPKENNCLMDIKIVLQDNELEQIIWQTENIRPDY